MERWNTETLSSVGEQRNTGCFSVWHSYGRQPRGSLKCSPNVIDTKTEHTYRDFFIFLQHNRKTYLCVCQVTTAAVTEVVTLPLAISQYPKTLPTLKSGTSSINVLKQWLFVWKSVSVRAQVYACSILHTLLTYHFQYNSCSTDSLPQTLRLESLWAEELQAELYYIDIVK